MTLSVPARTVSGRGSRHVVAGALAAFLGPIVVVRGRSADWAGQLADGLRRSGRMVLEVTGQGEPTLPTLDEMLALLRPHRPGAVVAVGGGSVIDLGKALAALLPQGTETALPWLEVVGDGRALSVDPLPFIALPTTAGTGAEATKNAVIDVPAHRRKVSLRDVRMLPDLAVLDADLTDRAPWPVTLACGMDALTQLVEPFLSCRARPDVDALCRVAIPLTMQALLTLERGEDRTAREVLLAAAHLSGIALANAGLGAVHGLAGVIGGTTGAPHGAVCARLLSPVLAANREACHASGLPVTRFDAVDSMIAAAFGTEGRASNLLSDWLHAQPLAPLGAMDAAEVASQTASSSSMKGNPVTLSPQTLIGVLGAAR